ncbi:alpha/beta hydrolase fold-domain-containing protein [Mycena crocata]|nr:alpha/beta hydrolase fold-domain-containing protein [Mycena crocata]
MLSGPLVLAALYLSHRAGAQTAAIFHWEHVKPSENLEWVECYSMYQCTRLEVPLDYANDSAGKAALAIIRLPATVSKEEYRGPLLFNPGGPGGSGIDALVPSGSNFHAVFGNQYDIVGFDPRGVSYSTPSISFFETGAERALWNAGALPISLNASSAAIPEGWARAHLLGRLAAARDAAGILKYITTDNVARDMLYITEKFGFNKLNYYGISYGTVLGATFAALFPDRVERILIDGVVDTEAWINANMTIEATDTDAELQVFFDSCAAAGPELCAFHKPTAVEISDRLAVLTASIRGQPVPVITPSSYGIVDYSVLRRTLFATLYVPYNFFGLLAEGLAALEGGNGTIIYSLTEQLPFQCECNDDSVPFHLNGAEATVAIQCGDAVEVPDSLADFEQFYNSAARTSQFAEFLVGANRLSCTGWRVYREDRFKGPVAAANTSFPLLLLANSADPVTPKAGALKVQARFPGSVLFTQDSPGHTSGTAPSLCTFTYFRQYFQNGTLPEPGSVCSVEIPLFGTADNSTATRRQTLSAEEQAATDALKVIGDAVRPMITRQTWQ